MIDSYRLLLVYKKFRTPKLMGQGHSRSLCPELKIRFLQVHVKIDTMGHRSYKNNGVAFLFSAKKRVTAREHEYFLACLRLA